METDPQVIVLIVFAAVAFLWAFVVAWRASAKFRRLVAWIRRTHPEQWNALPWFQRQIGKRAAVEGLRQRSLKDDREFAYHYGNFRRLHSRMAVLIIAGCAPIGLVLFGTQSWGWRW